MSIKTNSLLIRFEKQKYRALLDSRAQVSLIHRRVYDSMKTNQNYVNVA